MSSSHYTFRVQLLALMLQIGASRAALGSICIAAPQMTVDVHAVSASSQANKRPASDKLISSYPADDSARYNMNAAYNFKVTLIQRDGKISERPLGVGGPLTADQIAKKFPTFRPKIGEGYWLLDLTSLRDSARRQDEVIILSYSYTRYGFTSDNVYKNCNTIVTEELRTEFQP